VDELDSPEPELLAAEFPYPCEEELSDGLAAEPEDFAALFPYPLPDCPEELDELGVPLELDLVPEFP
jgi:hypothetical protein